MPKPRRKLSRPVPVRFEPEDLADLEAESSFTSIDLGSLIRSNVRAHLALRAQRQGFRYSQVDSSDILTALYGKEEAGELVS
jgi:hypothetical protein